MNDMIKRKDALKAVESEHYSDSIEVIEHNYYTDSLDSTMDFFEKTLLSIYHKIEDIPTAERHGEWIQKKQSIDGKYDFIWTECSECHQRPHDDFESDFCPNCGARMKGTDDKQT